MIAILSDFGCSEYLGAMKGVIYSINKKSIICDLCNTISPQNIREGAWILLNNYSCFPKGTVFLCVVDPGVGGRRDCIAVKTKNYFFVGPDNGLVYPASYKDGIREVFSLDSRAVGISKTFHGRDIFSRAAALVDLGNNLSKIGKKHLLREKLSFHLNGREGEVVRIDNFGNIITNLPHFRKKTYSVSANAFSGKMNFFETYDSAKAKTPFLINGSSNTLEISVKKGSASKLLKINSGEKIRIE